MGILAPRRKAVRSIRVQKQKATRRGGWLFAFPCWSLASQQIMAGGSIHRAFRRLSWPVSPLRGRFVGGCSCRVSAAFVGWPDFSSSRYITGTLSIAIDVPFLRPCIFKDLCLRFSSACLESNSSTCRKLQKTIQILNLSLALRAIMCASPRDHNPANRRSADETRLAGPLIDPVLQLKEAPDALRIYVIRN